MALTQTVTTLCRRLFGGTFRRGAQGLTTAQMRASMEAGSGTGDIGADVQRANKRKFTVSVEGNIGCGKSTLLEYFKKFPTVEALTEPVERWTDIEGHNGLQLLYEDPSRWNFTFNNYVMLTRLQMHIHQSTLPVKMLERSLFSTHHIFVENAHRSACMSAFEYEVLGKWYDHIVTMNEVNVDLIVYLRTSPDICMQRLRNRDRREESGVPLDLLSNLHHLYEEWLMDHKSAKPPAPVLVLDASPDISRMYQIYEEKKYEILCGCK